jgi:hypothetical protein
MRIFLAAAAALLALGLSAPGALAEPSGSLTFAEHQALTASHDAADQVIAGGDTDQFRADLVAACANLDVETALMVAARRECAANARWVVSSLTMASTMQHCDKAAGKRRVLRCDLRVIDGVVKDTRAAVRAVRATHAQIAKRKLPASCVIAVSTPEKTVNLMRRFGNALEAGSRAARRGDRKGMSRAGAQLAAISQGADPAPDSRAVAARCPSLT